MSQRQITSSRASSVAYFLGIVVLVLGIVHACGSQSQLEIHPAGDSFLPLAEGNMWVFEVRSDDDLVPSEMRDLDTVRIDRVIVRDGQRFYRIRADWPDLEDHRWLTRVSNGDVYWTTAPGEALSPYLLFSRNVGESWSTGLRDGCLRVLQMNDDYAVTETPYGRFDGVHMIGTPPQHCRDLGWEVSVARGIGPVQWTTGEYNGPQVRELVNARVRDDAPLTVSPPISRIMNDD